MCDKKKKTKAVDQVVQEEDQLHEDEPNLSDDSNGHNEVFINTVKVKFCNRTGLWQENRLMVWKYSNNHLMYPI